MDKSKAARQFLLDATAFGSVLGLDSIKALLDELGNPHMGQRVIHVAGTNGKGSVCAYLTSVLTRAGFKVGTYTSPAVFSEHERYCICNQWISEADYSKLLLEIKAACEGLVKKGKPHLTVFEIETALALLYFKRQHCQVTILEVGMGGATDATNVMDEVLCSVFASIGMDHMGFLGDSLSQIAHIKAGIIKPNCPAVSIWQSPDVRRELEQMAEKMNSELVFADEMALSRNGMVENTFNYSDFPALNLSMKGTYQIDNAALALEVIRLLRGQGFDISDAALADGMNEAHWPGRMECISQNPLIYIDGAHNLPAALRLSESINAEFTNKSLTFIMGVLADKQYEAMLELLVPLAEHFIAVTPANPRALAASTLARAATVHGAKSVVAAASLNEALEQAISYNSDAILAFGSLSYLGEFKSIAANHKENSVV